jgi:hypothetical protein
MKKKVYRIKNMSIDEVSSVSAGASRGARMLIRKNLTTENNVQDIRKSDLIAKLARGETNRRDMARYEQGFGELTKSAAGLSLISEAVAKERDAIIMRYANGDAADYLKRSTGDDGDNAGAAHPANANEDGGDNPYDAAVEHLTGKFMQSPGPGKNMNRDRAREHLARHDPVVRSLMVHSAQWDAAQRNPAS